MGRLAHRSGPCRFLLGVLPPQKARERRQRDIGHMMLNALGIEFRAGLRDADGAQKIDHEPVPRADTVGESVPLRRQKHTPVGF